MLTQLLDWLRVHFVEYDQMALDILKDDVPEVNPNFWKVVCSLTLQIVFLVVLCKVYFTITFFTCIKLINFFINVYRQIFRIIDLMLTRSGQSVNNINRHSESR